MVVVAGGEKKSRASHGCLNKKERQETGEERDRRAASKKRGQAQAAGVANRGESTTNQLVRPGKGAAGCRAASKHVST